ncbi:MAG: glycosyltransferase family 2 protein [Paracoccaceae bacterium]
MRNEGPFIVEWVAWYKMLGFRNIVVVTNNCTDRSPDLLDALQAAGMLYHLRHDVSPGQPITLQKLAFAKVHPKVRRAEWVLVCDVDEFLVINKGKGLLEDLLPHGAPFLGMSINWKIFGTAGIQDFVDVPVHRQFFSASSRKRPTSRFVKSIHRHASWFAALGEHGPRGLNLKLARKEWGSPGMVWVNARGEPLESWTPNGPYTRSFDYSQCAHEVAQMNHYMLRSVETFSLKSGTLSPVAGSDRYSAEYFKKADRADEIDTSAMRYATLFDVCLAKVMAVPGVARLHQLCCADHLRLIAEKHGREVAEDPRWHAFLDRAAAIQ